MIFSPSSDNVDKTPAQKSSTADIGVVPKRTSCTTHNPISEPMQWAATLPPSFFGSSLLVRNFCWTRFILLPAPSFGRYIQFALPLKSCPLGSVTERWWQTGTIYPVVTAARYRVENWTELPTKEVEAFVKEAEKALTNDINTQLHLISRKVHSVLASLLLFGVLVVLGLSGLLLDPSLLSVFSVGIGLLLLWFLTLSTYYSSAIRKTYSQMRTNLEWFCISHPDIARKGFTIKIIGPLLLHIALPES